jgi:hypothetical protein
MPGLPDLQASIAAHDTKLAALEASLAAHATRIEQIAVEAANGASVPALIDLTTEVSNNLNQTLDALKAWSDGEVSQTYLDSIFP